MKKTTLCSLFAIALVAFASSAEATVIMTTNSYSENFDATLSNTSGTPWSNVIGTQAPVPGTSGWDGVKAAGTGAGNMPYTVDNGAGLSGAIYNYGTTADPDRSLGSLASGSNTPNFGVEIINNSGAPITSVSIAYLGKYWRSSTSTQNTLLFSYEVGASGSTTYLTSGTATADATLNLVGPAPVTTNGPLDGNLPANQVSPADIINLSWGVGQSLYLRWADTNDTGNDAGLAVDNFALVAVPEPSTFVLGGLGLAGLAACIRRKRAA